MRSKKIVVISLAAALMLAACGGKKPAPETTAAAETTAPAATAAAETTTAAQTTAAAETEKAQETKAAESGSVTPQELYQAAAAAGNLPAMFEADADYLSNYYGINPSFLDGFVFAGAEDAALADSVVILKAKNPAQAAILSAALETVRGQKAAEMKNYIPAQYEIVNSSSVKVHGEYVYLVISEQAGAIEDAIEKLLD